MQEESFEIRDMEEEGDIQLLWDELKIRLNKAEVQEVKSMIGLDLIETNEVNTFFTLFLCTRIGIERRI
jgi:hypothetical protein